MQKIKNKKLRIGVLMGGRSVESEVSFNSGRTICDHIDIERYEVVPIFQRRSGALYILPLKFLHRGKTVDFAHRLESEAEAIVWDDLKARIDFLYIAVHGLYAEDGTLQGMCEVLGIAYLGTKVFGSAAGNDKIFQKKVLRQHGIRVPKDFSRETVELPCIVKPALEGSSIGVSVVHDKKDLEGALEDASYKTVTFRQQALIEERVSGMEFTCIGVQGAHEWEIFPLTEIVPEKDSEFYDYTQKYMPGRACKITPARCSQEATEKIVSTCIAVAQALGFTSFFRIDGFLTKAGDVVIIDPNTLSGMGPASFLFHQAAHIGMSHTRLINYLIECELARYGMLDTVSTTNKSRTMKDKKKKRVVVLLGGASNEREISLESGRNICYKLSPTKYDVIPVFVDANMGLYSLTSELLVQNSTAEIAQKVTKKIRWADLPSLADFVFIGLHGGKGENGSVQGMLEMLGLPYNGPGVLASALCMDKFKTNEFLKKAGLCVPKSMLVSKSTWRDSIKKIATEISFPLIVKPHDDGCSMYVMKVNSREDLELVLERYFSTEKTVALIEECVRGMELTCGVIGNEVVEVFPPSNSVAVDGVLSIEEKFLPGAGENQTPAPLPPEAIALVQREVRRAYEAVGCRGYARIDCFYQDDGRVVILEINTLPALTPATCLFHQALEVGVKPMELIDRIVELGCAHHSERFSRSECEQSL